jgi:hypothetical protein
VVHHAQQGLHGSLSASERQAFARRAPFEFTARDGGSAAHITLSHTSSSFQPITE